MNVYLYTAHITHHVSWRFTILLSEIGRQLVIKLVIKMVTVSRQLLEVYLDTWRNTAKASPLPLLVGISSFTCHVTYVYLYLAVQNTANQREDHCLSSGMVSNNYAKKFDCVLEIATGSFMRCITRVVCEQTYKDLYFSR